MHPFDRLHGTDTGSLIPGDMLGSGHRHDRHITAYHGTAPSLFGKLLARWRTLALHRVDRTAFLDIGAGKGRAMLLASEQPFRRIVGVELHPALAAAARENIEHWQSSNDGPPMRVEEGDVLGLRMPAGPCLLFLFNPFGAILMDAFLTRLQRQFAGREDECDLVYVNDEQRPILLEEHPAMRELWRGRVFLSNADRDADKAVIAHDADGLYVTSGYEDCSIWRLSA